MLSYKFIGDYQNIPRNQSEDNIKISPKYVKSAKMLAPTDKKIKEQLMRKHRKIIVK